MSKRDDDSQADMEVGMTTAERRRRRRRGGGLRVPSDNVPRRSTTPPVVAPVPEDPALAMSIAYSFTEDGRTRDQFPVPEAIPTVIDPVSGPIEQADFDVQTREMTAVDLEALGLADAGISGSIPMQRTASGTDPRTTLPHGVQVRFRPPRGPTEPVEDVDVELDAVPDQLADDADSEAFDDDVALGDSGTTLDQAGGEGDEGETAPDGMSAVTAPPRSGASAAGGGSGGSFRTARAQTVALSEDDLEEVREAARQSSYPPHRALSTSIPPPMPPGLTKPSEPRRRDTGSVPEIDIMALEERANETGEFEVDVEGIVDARSAPVAMPVGSPGVPPLGSPSAGTSGPLPTSGSSGPAYAAGSSGPSATASSLGAVSSLISSLPVPSAASSGPTAAPPLPQAPPAIPTPPPVQPAAAAAMERARRISQPPGQLFAPVSSTAPTQPLPQTASAVAPAAAPPSLRDSQPFAMTREAPHAPPPPPPVAHKAPPSPPPGKRDKAPPMSSSLSKADLKPPRGKPWFVDLFDEDYLRTLPFLTPQATQAEAEFVIDAMGLQPGAQVLDIGCGYGRHAMELAARGFHVVGLDLSTPLLVRGGEEAHRRGLTINFVRGDMRELDFDAQFDGAYCLFSTFGYFDDETNKKTVGNIARALKPGGRVLIEILNRDYVISDLPTRVWWEGDGCVVLEEVDLNYFSSRIQINRSVVFDDGRQIEQEISLRAYSLHEVGKLLHLAGFRVLEVSGAYHTRGRFFGNQSRHIIVLAERKDPTAA